MTRAAPGLVADVGGTHARFALCRPGARPDAPTVYRNDDFRDLGEVAERFLAQAGGAARPERAAFAVAAPIAGDCVTLTNRAWRFSVEALRKRLALEHLAVINDFAAVALSIPELGPSEREQIGAGEAIAGAPVAVLGPGTGLGVSGLVRGERRWVPVAGEGGHVDFAPLSEREAAIHRLLQQRFAHVSIERIASGPGLVNLYQAIATLEGADDQVIGEPPTPAEIAARARGESCPLCAEALAIFCDVLGAAAGNLALTFGARGGVYLAGGIVPKLVDQVRASEFRRRFEAKGRFAAYLEAVPSYVITAPDPTLIGLSHLLAQGART